MNLMTFLFKMLSMISHMISIASSWNRNSGYSQVGESFRILDLSHVVDSTQGSESDKISVSGSGRF